MKSIRFTFIFISFILAVSHLWGCRSTTPNNLNSIDGQRHPAASPLAEDRVTVFFFRQANFAGGGRIHILEIDNKSIGPLTADNYYRLEMWPGEYHFSISLPREEFFGRISPPITISRQITLALHPTASTYLCGYTDGMGSGGFSIQRITDFPKQLKNRTLAKSLGVRETAQLTQFYDARYDGPAMTGQPHGPGTLTWADDCIYKGVFQHGTPTRKAKFYFPDGRIFIGPNYRGRPASPGILMTPQGRILFAGKFVDEKPDGVGMRSGPDGPEFCEYANGRDITKTFRQLAKEALDVEDQQAINSAKQEFIAQLQASRYEREISKAKLLRRLHQAKVEKERRWCREEFDQGRNLCTCAPLADDFATWQECWEPLRKRHID